MEYNHLQLIMSKGNVLLQKAELGKNKTGFHQLPAQEHVYGKAPTKDQFGARQVVSGWQESEGSKVSEPPKNFVAMNREGVKNGCIDSKQITNFRKDNEIKVKVKEGQKYYGVSIPNEEFTYGVSNRPSTPIKEVICNVYAENEAEARREKEAVMKMLAKERKSPPKVEAVRVQKAGPSKKKEVEEHNFKLSKFKNVESKVKSIIQK